MCAHKTHFSTDAWTASYDILTADWNSSEYLS